MKLWGLRCGDLHTDVGRLVGGDAPSVMADVPIMCFAVDTGDGVVVFDTGLHEACCGADPSAHFGPMWTVFEVRCPRHALIDQRLRQAGIAVDDVAWVVNSHLHFDHAGRNAAFPGAKQLVRAREMEWGHAVSMKPAGGVLAGDLAELDAPPWDYEDRFEVTAGVTLLATPGHTPGHQSMLVEFVDGRRFVCAGDAAYTVQAVLDHQPTGRPFDAAAAVASLQLLTSLDAEILTSHDVPQWRDVQDAVMLHSA